jgi:hypothetical protein
MHRGPMGTVAINHALQLELNPLARATGPTALLANVALGDGAEGGDGDGDDVPSGRALLGDRVLQTRNNYDDGVVNGAVGARPLPSPPPLAPSLGTRVGRWLRGRCFGLSRRGGHRVGPLSHVPVGWAMRA